MQGIFALQGKYSVEDIKNKGMFVSKFLDGEGKPGCIQNGRGICSNTY